MEHVWKSNKMLRQDVSVDGVKAGSKGSFAVAALSGDFLSFVLL